MLAVYDKSSFNNAVFVKHSYSFQPFLVRKTISTDQINALRVQICAYMLDSTQVTDVSCNSQPNEDFVGDPEHRETVQIKVKDFMEAFLCQRNETKHWLHDADLDLYLSQCCVYAKEKQFSQLHDLQIDFTHILPDPTLDVETVNLWINLCAARSRLHYDANHNLLYVLEGCKELWLIPPELTQFLSPASALIDTPNHSLLSVDDVISLLPSLQKAGKCRVVEIGLTTLHEDFGLSDLPKVFHVQKIEQGDLIFIPEGWWHQVLSQKGTFAINIWFASSFATLFSSNFIHMRDYLLRSITYHVNQTATIGTLSSLTHLNSKITDGEFFALFNHALSVDADTRSDEGFDSCEELLRRCPFHEEPDRWLKLAREVRLSNMLLFKVMRYVY